MGCRTDVHEPGNATVVMFKSFYYILYMFSRERERKREHVQS